MNRSFVTFPCGGAELHGTLDRANGDTGLLIVSGGNEVRSGAWAGQALLAARIAGAGHPVLRFDRRGIGDSEGENGGFRSSRADIAAALAAFRQGVPQLRRVVGFGNCDAASALALFGADLGLDALVLANPWTVDGEEVEPAQAPAALRRRYAARLADPSEWKRLLGGGVDLAKLGSGLRQALSPAQSSALAAAMHAGLARFAGRADILLAKRDRTAQLFLSAWDGGDARIARLDSASHSFAGGPEREWLYQRVLEALRAG